MQQTMIDRAVHMDDADLLEQLRADVRDGLRARPRWLSPRWFYDAAGSELFDLITEQPEYYPYAAERSILDAHAADIADAVGRAVLVELGSGSSSKTLLLLDSLRHRSALAGIVTLDVSSAALDDAATTLAARYPGTPLHTIVGDYGRHLQHVPPAPDDAVRLLVFLGSTLGNLIPDERAAFLASCARMLQPGEPFLLGTDLIKDAATLEAAYDDAAGVTARFNANILEVLRRRLSARVEVDDFSHEATWMPEESWVQIALRATRRTTIDVPGLVTTTLDVGEPILTEVSTKFTTDGIDAELTAAGFATEHRWLDEQGRFAVTLARRT